MKKIFINLASLFIPIRSWRKNARMWMNKNLSFPPIFIIKSRYITKINFLQQKDEIIVVFLVWEASKWNGDTLYKKFENSKIFKPIILVASENAKDCAFYF